MAAIYHITQDSEKENPRNKAMKEKLVTTNKSHVLQPLGASALGGPFKDQPNKQGRANFSLLNNNPNARLIISNSNNNAVGGGNTNIANNTSNKLVSEINDNYQFVGGWLVVFSNIKLLTIESFYNNFQTKVISTFYFLYSLLHILHFFLILHSCHA